MTEALWRATCLALVAFALVWVAATIATLPPSGLFGMAQGIQRGRIYAPDAIRTILAQTSEADCRTEIRRSALLLHLQLFDAENRLDPAVMQGEPRGSRLAATRRAARALLDCAPSESLGWLALYLTSIRQDGFGPEAVAQLAAAYRNAPHEAWLQALRLPAVFAAYAALPQSLQRMAMNDFDDLLGADMHQAVASLIAGSPRALQGELLAKLCTSPRDQQALIAHELDRAGRDLMHPCLPDLSRPAYLR